MSTVDEIKAAALQLPAADKLDKVTGLASSPPSENPMTGVTAFHERLLSGAETDATHGR